MSDASNSGLEAVSRTSVGDDGRDRAGAPPPALARHFLIAGTWYLMAPAMIMAMVLTSLVSLALPSKIAACLGFVAVAMTAATPLFVAFERNRAQRAWQRYVAMLTGIGLPMLLFGFAIAQWNEQSDRVSGENAVAVLVMTGMLAATVLSGRVASIVTAMIMLWIGVSIVAGTPFTSTVLAAGLVLGIYIGMRQGRFAADEEQRHRVLERAHRRAEELLAEYEESGQGWFWEADRRGMIAYVSPTIGALLGRRHDALVGRPLTELFDLDAADQQGERTLHFHLTARSSFQELEVRAATAGEERWWSISGRPIHDGFNNFLGFRGSGHDLTEKRRSQERASRLAMFDSLTGLANRFQMSQTLEKILNAQREEHRLCTVFLIDLDRFKQVNDSLGHPAGDALLKQVAQRLEWTVGDAGQVGRLGGDEFQVILPGGVRREDLAELADRVIVNLSQPYSIEGQRVVIGASVGIARAPDDGVTSEALIRNADLALYAAKDGGRGRHHFYDPGLHSNAEERLQLEQDMREAIANGGFELYYQPVVHLHSERITGFEALLRWDHPRLGPLSPAKFVPIAEDAGLIAQIGEWALRTACMDMASWPDSVRCAVNVSALQFANAALPSIVTNALAAAQVTPSRLELEITESVFLNDDGATEAMFAALKRVGVRLALDDFGTGYSSLGYLKKAPFDKIKIDQSFVRGATVDGSRNGAIICSIVNLAEALNMETTAEGVETLDELDLVRLLGCSHVQGYIYEHPLSASAAVERLAEGLDAIAHGPKSARAPRRTMLRKVMLEHGGETYPGTIRNISATGAMVEGLWSVPDGTVFSLHMAKGHVIDVTARWSVGNRIGIEFAQPLEVHADGRISILPPRRDRTGSDPAPLRRSA